MRYAVFAFQTYYPGGGWEDLLELAGTIEGAYDIVKNLEESFSLIGDYDTPDEWQIVDLLSGTAIESAVSHTIYDQGDYYPPGRYWQRFDPNVEEAGRDAIWELLEKLTPRGTVFDKNKGEG